MRRTWAPDAWLRLTAVLPRPRARGAVMMFAVLILNTCQGRAVCRWRCECTRIATVEATALRTSIDIPYLALHAYCGGCSAVRCRERIYQLNSYLAPEGRILTATADPRTWHVRSMVKSARPAHRSPFRDSAANKKEPGTTQVWQGVAPGYRGQSVKGITELMRSIASLIASPTSCKPFGHRATLQHSDAQTTKRRHADDGATTRSMFFTWPLRIRTS
jgi:hypothetical protein